MTLGFLKENVSSDFNTFGENNLESYLEFPAKDLEYKIFFTLDIYQYFVNVTNYSDRGYCTSRAFVHCFMEPNTFLGCSFRYSSVNGPASGVIYGTQYITPMFGFQIKKESELYTGVRMEMIDVSLDKSTQL
jgi:hypothetical protein